MLVALFWSWEIPKLIIENKDYLWDEYSNRIIQFICGSIWFLDDLSKSLEDKALDHVGSDGVRTANSASTAAEVIAYVVPSVDNSAILERVADAVCSKRRPARCT